jgi:Mg-chelatase subunit ChlD
MRNLIKATLAFALILHGCITTGSQGGGGGEPVAGPDQAPPSTYRPYFVRNSRPVSTAGGISPTDTLTISRIVTSDPSRTRLYVHVVDPSGNYLSGATSSTMKSIWCGVEEKFNGRTASPKFTLKEVTEADREPHAIALVMDHSGSMGDERAFAVQNAADQLISRKKPQDALALVKYDSHIGIESTVSRDADELRSRLQKTGLAGYGQMTAILDGIAAGISQVAGVPGIRQKAVIIFTDGQDNSSTISADSVITLARRTGTIINAIDFGYGVNADLLRNVAAATGGIYQQIYGTGEFNDIFDDIYRRLHNYYLIEYPQKEFGVHEIRLKLCLPNDTLIAMGSYDNTPTVGAIGLLDVNFDFDKAELQKASLPAVDNVVALMKAFPAMTIELRGHTDASNNTGDPDYNLKLSQRRADAVKKALVGKGVPEGRITANGFGERYPVADNSTDEGRARNRRTEFVILSK